MRLTSIFVIIFILGALSVHGFFWNPDYSADDAMAIPERVIIALDISGNRVLADEEIIQKANLRAQVNTILTPAKIADDLDALLSLGYFREAEVNFSEELRGVRVTYQVTEYPVVKQVQFVGNQAFSDNQLADKMQTKSGSALNMLKLEQDIAALDSLYQEKGYDLSHVKKVSFDEESYVLQVAFTEITIAAIIITGNEKTRDHVINREISSETGDIYNSIKLRKDRNEIIKLGYFASVSSPELLPGTKPNTVRVVFRVKEQKVNLINFGTGFTETDPWFVFLNLQFNNPFGTGEALELQSEYSEEKQTYSAQYYHPWLFHSPTRFTARAWNTLAQETLYQNDANDVDMDISRIGYAGRLAYPLSESLDVALTYKAERVREMAAEQAVSADIHYQIRSLTLAGYFSDVYYSDWNYLLAGTDMSVSLEQGGLVGGLLDLSGVNFARYDGYLSHYSPLFGSEQDVLAARLRAGLYTQGNDDKPILEGEQYLVGGASTVRGIPDNSAEVKVGSKLLLLNLEYRHMFSEYWQGVVFWDYGSAFDDNLETAVFTSGRGIGVRLNIFGMVFRFDQAWVDENGYLHFSLGQMF